ncbi:hypothetical protein Q428_06250 [Fervidicella metallireducens AeB]|uniref:Uncharacterized protein n=1 Tax=Fervidicella metallireducens AeB TaxID=1403537 RepID=A0A017RXT9_9CLOT|nr:sigma-70 family RNA polymerase sigma factor [Fervidicella metallireducens]EYE88760.1 hypothetical protein Q428_06250 [Fervidicella metallireducens AeB]
MIKEKLIKVNDEYVVMDFDKIFKLYKGMIHNLCNKWKHILEYGDLFQVASFGLLKAFNDYDLTKGCEFSTLAYTYIKNEIRMFYREAKKSFGYISLNEQMSSNDREEYINNLREESFEDYILEEISKKQDLDRIYKGFRHLTERQKDILTKYYLDGLSMPQIANLLGFHVSYVHKVITNSLTKLRRIYNEEVNKSCS